VQDRAGSKTYTCGVLDKTAGAIQPALLARALRAVAVRQGVRIFENSPVVAIDNGSRLVVRTPGASVTADSVALATNAWMGSIRELQRAMIVVSSDMIATAPIPNRLRDIGWIGGEGVADSRLMVHYLQTTRDGRIALGRGSGALAYFGRVTKAFESPGRRYRQIERGFRFLYPQLSDVPVDYAWTGAIDRTRSGTMIFGNLSSDPRIHYCAGYSGTGVAPSVVASRVLASRLLDLQDEWQRSPINRNWLLKYPPDPARFFGGLFVRSQVFRKEEGEQQGRSARPIRSWIAHQADPRMPQNLR
jgi:glycine/D-amino acid oxidase-like deaminating enzyme